MQAHRNRVPAAIGERNAKNGTSQRHDVLVQGHENRFNRNDRRDIAPPFRGTHNREIQGLDTPVIPDEIDISPEAILALANKFCRSKSVEQLEQEWCDVNGIREQMKRDFKVKRTRSLRDRNLGSGPHRG